MNLPRSEIDSEFLFLYWLSHELQNIWNMSKEKLFFNVLCKQWGGRLSKRVHLLLVKVNALV